MYNCKTNSWPDGHFPAAEILAASTGTAVQAIKSRIQHTDDTTNAAG
jgi:hypothetical protein